MVFTGIWVVCLGTIIVITIASIIKIRKKK